MVNFQDDKQQKKITELHAQEAEGLALMLSERYQIPYIDLSKISINTDALRLIDPKEAEAAGAAAFRLTGKNIHLAVLSPNNEKISAIKEDLKNRNLEVITYIVSENSLKRALGMYEEVSASAEAEAGLIQISDQRINQFTQELKTLKDIQSSLLLEIEHAVAGSGISGILELILSGALVVGASDIHIEPEEVAVRMRYRLDGVLQDVADIPEKVFRQILSRLKLVSGMKLNVKLAAQDGRFSIKVGGEEIEIRSSIIPSAYGESVVMRVLDPKSINVSFESLGIEPRLMEIFSREIQKPNGLILLTGPTGSGKTTTLYSFLRKVNSTETKIITIEDPIEYHLDGVNQTQVNRAKGYTFLSGLRAALRQDPDIIMVGEIRDGETAKIAINSALTGHLVFSTLHTNNAAGAIPRLIDLGVNAKIISSALTLSIAQRLVRKLCTACKQETILNPEDKVLVDKIVSAIQKRRPDIKISPVEKIWTPVGCERCNNTGYKGRIGVFEAIIMDQAIAETTINNPNERDIRLSALSQGILDMREDGMVKILRGETSLEELRRVVDLNQEFLMTDSPG